MAQSRAHKTRRQHAAQATNGDKHRQCLDRGGLAKHVLEKESGNQQLRLYNVRLSHGCKVGDVGQHVQHRDGADGQRRRNGERPPRVAHLAEDVVGALPPAIGVDDAEDGIRVGPEAAGAVARHVGAGEGVLKVVRVVRATVTRQRGEAREDNDEHHDNLEDAHQVHQTDAPFREQAVYEDRQGDAGDADAPGDPALARHPRAACVDDELAKRNGLPGGESEERHLGGEDAGCEVLWLAEDALEVVLFAARSGDGEAEFEIDGQTEKREYTAAEP